LGTNIDSPSPSPHTGRIKKGQKRKIVYKPGPERNDMSFHHEEAEEGHRFPDWLKGSSELVCGKG